MAADTHADAPVSRIAAAIGEPARTRMLFCLLDGRARTATELAVVAGVSPSTASVHLQRLVAGRLLALHPQGKHRYYRLRGPDVARVLESLSVLAGASCQPFVPNTPQALRFARTCYDHIAGALGVALHDRLVDMGWLAACDLTAAGDAGLRKLGIDADLLRSQRRRFIAPCLDWSERKPHLAGSLASALLDLSLARKWVFQELDSRALELTPLGRREFTRRFGIEFAKAAGI